MNISFRFRCFWVVFLFLGIPVQYSFVHGSAELSPWVDFWTNYCDAFFRQPVLVVKSQLPLYGLCLFPVGACVVLLVQETEQNQLYLHNSNGLGIVWRICRSLSSHNQFVYHARKRQRSVTEPFRYLPQHNLLVDILPAPSAPGASACILYPSRRLYARRHPRQRRL